MIITSPYVRAGLSSIPGSYCGNFPKKVSALRSFLGTAQYRAAVPAVPIRAAVPQYMFGTVQYRSTELQYRSTHRYCRYCAVPKLVWVLHSTMGTVGTAVSSTGLHSTHGYCAVPARVTNRGADRVHGIAHTSENWFNRHTSTH